MALPFFNSAALEEILLNRLKSLALFKIVVILKDSPYAREGLVFGTFLVHNRKVVKFRVSK